MYVWVERCSRPEFHCFTSLNSLRVDAKPLVSFEVLNFASFGSWKNMKTVAIFRIPGLTAQFCIP